jgi:dissimilatory sulfite reductase (desulfoviridin) alpha/beta subunit
LEEDAVQVTMIRKILESGEECPKCQEAARLIKEKGHWEKITKIVDAVVGNEESEGFQLSRQYAVERAPFFIVEKDDGEKKVIVSVLQFVREMEKPS